MKRPWIATVLPWLLFPAMAGEKALATNAPQLRIEETVDYYDVSARDRVGLIKDMRVPEGGDGYRQAHGMTHASFTIERAFTQKPGQCSIGSLGIHLRLRMTLPRWKPGIAIPHGLRQDWDEVRRLVGAHENRHRQHALDAAFAMRDRFAAIEPAANCAILEARLQRALDAALLRQHLADQFLDQRQAPAALRISEHDLDAPGRTMMLRGR